MAILDVEKLATELARTELVNLDTPIKEVLKVDGIGSVDPMSRVSSYAAVWDHYVVVCGMNPGSIAELPAVAQSVRRSFGE